MKVISQSATGEIVTDKQTPRSASETTIALLKDYRERRQDFRVFCDYNEAMKHMRGGTSAKIDVLEEPLRDIAARLFSIADNGFFILEVCEWKIDYIAEAVIHSIKAKNPIALANSVRALVEHLAALVAVLKELGKLEMSLRGQGHDVAIIQALDRAEKFIHRAFYGKSPKVAKDKAHQALHVNDCLKVLKEDVADIDEVYDFLCEYVHPNYGSNLLVSTGRLATGLLNPPEQYHRETLDRICRYSSLCMLFLRGPAIQYCAVFLRLQDLVEFCFLPGATVSNVFAIKTANPKGDGKSKETAYYFPKARTAMEAVQLCGAFLEEHGFEVRERQIGDTDDMFIYDVYNTDKGTFWFRVPMLQSNGPLSK